MGKPWYVDDDKRIHVSRAGGRALYRKEWSDGAKLWWLATKKDGKQDDWVCVRMETPGRSVLDFSGVFRA